MKHKPVVYLNLTNGLEALPKFKGNYKLIRIQSTACEQKRWEFILMDLDYGFLFDLALGKKCYVIDYSQHKEMSRALYQGLEWIKYALNRVWFNRKIPIYIKNNKVSDYFDSVYKTLDNKTLKKLKYFKKFLQCRDITIIPVGNITTHDGDIEFYQEMVKKYA